MDSVEVISDCYNPECQIMLDADYDDQTQPFSSLVSFPLEVIFLKAENTSECEEFESSCPHQLDLEYPPISSPIAELEAPTPPAPMISSPLNNTSRARLPSSNNSRLSKKDYDKLLSYKERYLVGRGEMKRLILNKIKLALRKGVALKNWKVSLPYDIYEDLIQKKDPKRARKRKTHLLD